MKKIVIFIFFLLINIGTTYAVNLTYINPTAQDIVSTGGTGSLMSTGVVNLPLTTPLNRDNISASQFCFLKGGLLLNFTKSKNDINRTRIIYNPLFLNWSVISNKDFIGTITCSFLIAPITNTGGITTGGTTNTDLLIAINNLNNTMITNANNTRFVSELYIYFIGLTIFYFICGFSFRFFRRLQFMYPWTNNK